jgi:Asp-tRNA(Asn)/Glu-tRNA(Gln) amidotransferase A subunit family amidase
MAAAAMGTQTGVSLYAPSTGASLAAFRGTDGLSSTEGVMPLTWATDYAGPIAKTVTDLASMLELREDAIGAGAELVEAMEAAATATADNQLVGNVFASLDAVRGDLDQLASATGAVTDGDVTAVDAQVVVTMRGNLTKAASTLSTAIFDQLTSQLTERRAAAERDRQLATAALALVILLALFPTGTGLRDLLRYQRERRARERSDEEPPIGPGPQWTRETAVAGRERAGAAR